MQVQYARRVKTTRREAEPGHYGEAMPVSLRLTQTSPATASSRAMARIRAIYWTLRQVPAEASKVPLMVYRSRAKTALGAKSVSEMCQACLRSSPRWSSSKQSSAAWTSALGNSRSVASAMVCSACW